MTRNKAISQSVWFRLRSGIGGLGKRKKTEKRCFLKVVYPFEDLVRVTGVLSRKMPGEVYLLWIQFQEVNNPLSSVLDPNQDHLS